jgi:hypothetical protein
MKAGATNAEVSSCSGDVTSESSGANDRPPISKIGISSRKKEKAARKLHRDKLRKRKAKLARTSTENGEPAPKKAKKAAIKEESHTTTAPVTSKKMKAEDGVFESESEEGEENEEEEEEEEELAHGIISAEIDTQMDPPAESEIKTDGAGSAAVAVAVAATAATATAVTATPPFLEFDHAAIRAAGLLGNGSCTVSTEGVWPLPKGEEGTHKHILWIYDVATNAHNPYFVVDKSPRPLNKKQMDALFPKKNHPLDKIGDNVSIRVPCSPALHRDVAYIPKLPTFILRQRTQQKIQRDEESAKAKAAKAKESEGDEDAASASVPAFADIPRVPPISPVTAGDAVTAAAGADKTVSGRPKKKISKTGITKESNSLGDNCTYTGFAPTDMGALQTAPTIADFFTPKPMPSVATNGSAAETAPAPAPAPKKPTAAAKIDPLKMTGLCDKHTMRVLVVPDDIATAAINEIDRLRALDQVPMDLDPSHLAAVFYRFGHVHIQEAMQY